MLVTVVLRRLGGLRAPGFGAWGGRGEAAAGRWAGRPPEDPPCRERSCVVTSAPLQPRSAPLSEMPGAELCGKPRTEVFPSPKGQPQIIRCLKPPNSPHLFLLLWAGFLSQRRERLPPCSPAVNGLSRGPGTIARVCCPPWEQLFLGPTKIPPAARAEPPARTAVLASSPLPGCLLPPEPGAGTEEGQRVWGESNP